MKPVTTLRLALVAATFLSSACASSTRVGGDDGDDAAEEEALPPCVPEDRDGDGFLGDGCGGDDCDDDDATVHPGALETCQEGVDRDCDGFVGDRGSPVLLMDPVVLVDRLTPTGNFYTRLHWTGDGYSLVWRQFDGEGIYLIRLDALGNRIGGEVRIRDYLSAYDSVWTGTGYGTAWSTGNVYFQLLDETGTPLGAEVEVASTGEAALDGSVSYGPRLFWTGDSFVLIWLDTDARASGWGLHLARLDSEGRAEIESARVGGPALTVNGRIDAELGGDDLGVVLEGDRGTARPTGGWTLVRVRHDGTLLTPPTHLLDAGWPEIPDLRVLGTAEGFALAWLAFEPDFGDTQSLYLQRLDSSGALSGDPLLVGRCDAPIAGGGYTDHSMNAAVMGDGVAFLWRDRCESEQRHLFRSVGWESEPDLAPLVIARDTGQRSSELVWTGTEVGISWASGPREDQRIYFARIGFCE